MTGLPSDTERVVLCFDRDYTVSVNGHPERAAVPIGWVQYWAHETVGLVWTTGNQHLKSEAAIPGLAEAEELWEDDLGNDSYEYANSEIQHHITPRRGDGLRLIQDLYETTFPDDTFRFIVVENPKLIAILDDIYTDAVAEVYDTQITMSPPQH